MREDRVWDCNEGRGRLTASIEMRVVNLPRTSWTSFVGHLDGHVGTSFDLQRQNATKQPCKRADPFRWRRDAENNELVLATAIAALQLGGK